MKPRTAAWCAALVLAGGMVAWSQPAPVPSPPWLGGAKYTVHAAGPVGEVVKQLAQIIGRPINSAPVPGAGETEKQVTLDFTDTPVEEILLSLCKQAGLVYDVAMTPGGYGIYAGIAGVVPLTLRAGDPEVDARPAVVVGDYVVRVTTVSLYSQKALALRWGESQAARSGNPQGMQLGLEVTARTAEAAQRLAGLSTQATATPDKGEAIVPAQQYRPGYYLSAGPVDALVRGITLNLPLPVLEAAQLAKLEGALLLFSEVKVTEMKITPGSVLETFKQDDAVVVVSNWVWATDPRQGGLSVDLVGQVPMLPKGTTPAWLPSDWAEAVLVTKDGKEFPAQGFMFPGAHQPGGEWRLSFRFFGAGNVKAKTDGVSTARITTTAAGAGGPAPGAGGPAPAGGEAAVDYQKLDWDYLRLTLVRTGAADKALPFVLENIPLP